MVPSLAFNNIGGMLERELRRSLDRLDEASRKLTA